MAKMMAILAGVPLSQAVAGTCFGDVIAAAEVGVPIVAEVTTLVASCKGDDKKTCISGVVALIGSLNKLEESITQAVGDCGGATATCTTAVKKIGDDIGKMDDVAKKMQVDCVDSTTKCISDGAALAEAALPIAADIAAASTSCPKTTSYDWCDCGKGTNWVDVWDPNHPEDKHRIPVGGWTPVEWQNPVSEISWVCDGMSDNQKANLPVGASWRVSFTTGKKTVCMHPGEASGRIEWDSAPKSANATVDVVIV